MIRNYLSLFFYLLSTILFLGCQENYGGSNESSGVGQTQTEAGHGHTHGDADKLVWVKQDIQQDGYQINLGHHGEQFHGGDMIEPAVMIMKDGQDISDAVVHNCLVADDSTLVLVPETATTFEPKTDDEPAHYAQASMEIPKGQEKCIVRFKIELPGVKEARMMDIEITTH